MINIMWEEWIFKTVIAFLSIQILQIVFGKYIGYAFKNCNEKGVGHIKGTINALLVSMIPFLRWIFVGLIVIVIVDGIILINDDKKDDKDKDGTKWI